MSEYKLSHLQELEAESIHIIREVAAEFENPVMLYSIGKDSSVMVRLAEKAFAPGKVPFPLMHIDSKWKFKEMIQFRDDYAKKYGWNLIVESNMEAFRAGVGPFTHGSKVHTDLMKTKALLDALSKYKFDAAFGGARRDEEKSRAKERIFSFRDQFQQWDPKNQRPELWDIYNARIHKGESIRVFPLSNWTELDIWQYIRLENIPIVPLYLSILLKVMKEKNLHEDCIQQKYRLVHDRLCNPSGVPVDDRRLIRMDDYEMKTEVQQAVEKVWNEISQDNLAEAADIDEYWKEFYEIFGFKIAGVDYDADCDIQVQIPSLS
mgnify:CR=1 FL=1